MENPFYYGGPVAPARLLGRERELRRLFDRLSTGQSVAVTGQPHAGKTSLLKCVIDASWRTLHRPNKFDSTIFCFLDAQLSRVSESSADFWRRALLPLGEAGDRQTVIESYRRARKAGFEVFSLQRLFGELSSAGTRVVLVIDEFDDTLAQPHLNNPAFYGALRSLSSTTSGLSCVISSRYDLAHLNRLTQEINPHGSPYFNTLTEIPLGSIGDEAVRSLVTLLGDQMASGDFQFVKSVSGGHPYLAQATGAVLWDLREDGLSGEECYLVAGKHLHRQFSAHFEDCWRIWSNEVKQVATALALAQIPSYLGNREIRAKEILENILDYSSELVMLEANGILAQGSAGEWRVQQGAFLWWLADEVRRALRNEIDFRAWLQAQEIDILLTRQQRDRFELAAKGTLAALGKGATTLIEAFAKGVGGMLTGIQ